MLAAAAWGAGHLLLLTAPTVVAIIGVVAVLVLGWSGAVPGVGVGVDTLMTGGIVLAALYLLVLLAVAAAFAVQVLRVARAGSGMLRTAAVVAGVALALSTASTLLLGAAVALAPLAPAASELVGALSRLLGPVLGPVLWVAELIGVLLLLANAPRAAESPRRRAVGR